VSSSIDSNVHSDARDPDGTVVTVTGGDWDDALRETGFNDEHMVVNMGPQHPSTHGVLRMVLTLEGETVVHTKVVIGYLHTGIEKNLEFRNWTQGVTFVTRMDYLSNFFNETAYCLGVEKLLGIEVPPRATTIRVLLMELERIASHLVWLATTGLELGAISVMLYGWRERELILDIKELITGLRMNNAYIRPGGLASDMPVGAEEKVREFLREMPKRLREYENLLSGSPIWQARTQGIGYLDVDSCIALGVTGPILRSAGMAWDIRKAEPYCGYETYEFDVPTTDTCDVWGRYLLRLAEIRESLRIVEQAVDRLEPGP
jgi:NADH-quinone oxidoreductase subunit D